MLYGASFNPVVKISIVTAVRNGAKTIQQAIDSIGTQKGCTIEYIVVDGMSHDGTEDILRSNESKIDTLIREPDHGIYDAMNKGLKAATGDIVGFLHADDSLADPKTLSQILNAFQSERFDAVYGDLVYVKATDDEHLIRYWQGGNYCRQRFRRGWMPPHPTVYVKKHIYDQLGNYRNDFGSAADYECMVRLMVKNNIKVGYIPEILVKMRMGGKSNATLRNRLAANRWDRRAWSENGLKPPLGLRLFKPLSKLPQYWQRPKPARHNHKT